MSDTVGVGVAGSTSTVARLAVLPALERSSACRLVATASRSDSSATYDSYDALLADDSVEAVYVPLPNAMHRPFVERCAAAHKHVLCEKPLASTAEDAVAMRDACESAGVVLMEAYMTPFHPRDEAVRRIVASGDLGEVLFASSAFTGVLDKPDDHRWRPEMGGGALLDVGIYCLTPILFALGWEAADGDGGGALGLAATARRAPLGVDASFSAFLGRDDGRSAHFQCSFEAPERQELEIVGTHAAISLERPFTPGPADTSIRRRARDGSVEVIEAAGADPYLGMVEHFGKVVRGDEQLSRTPEDSIALQRLVDRLAAAAAGGVSLASGPP